MTTSEQVTQEMTVLAYAPRSDGAEREPVRVLIEDAWLIWSVQHNAWWGPAFCGYFVSPFSAGLYTREAAEEESEPMPRRDGGFFPAEERAERLLDVLLRNCGRTPSTPTAADAIMGLIESRAALSATPTPEGR